jgi:hypothetical protein
MDQVTRIEAIAFDLDMTLVDSRPVSQRALDRLVCEYGAQLDIDTLMSAYGLPLARCYPRVSTTRCSGSSSHITWPWRWPCQALAPPSPPSGKPARARSS